jgi:hypothetical protein
MTTPDTSQSDKQPRSERIDKKLPISINEKQGVTRDISASGMFIVVDDKPEIGSQIEFTVDLDTLLGKIQLCCQGEVVRVEAVDRRVGIGIKIIKQFGQQLILES